jgi:protein-glutamine gamma-glutamyltransferase
VLSYDSAQQEQLLEKILGSVTPLRLATMIVGGGSFIGFMIFGLLLLKRPSVHLTEHQLIFKQLCKKLKPLGFEPIVGESPNKFLSRVISARGDLTGLQTVSELYEQFTYADDNHIKQQLQKSVRSLKLNRK